VVEFDIGDVFAPEGTEIIDVVQRKRRDAGWLRCANAEELRTPDVLENEGRTGVWL
jgi:hypothetical protein